MVEETTRSGTSMLEEKLSASCALFREVLRRGDFKDENEAIDYINNWSAQQFPSPSYRAFRAIFWQVLEGVMNFG